MLLGSCRRLADSFVTGFDWRAIILSLVNLALAVIIYLPFVKLANNPKFEEK